MSTHKLFTQARFAQARAAQAFGAAALVVTLVASVALADGPNEGPRLGKPITPSEIAPWDFHIMPDGTGLPAGSGTSAQGAPIFAQKCAACHGEGGKGGPNGALVGGPPRATLDGGKMIANYWPVSTTLFDFIRRAMPYTQPGSLTAQEVYALCAYLLAENKLIGQNEVMDAQSLPKIKMPNRDNFIVRFPDRI